jgi:hypothetical protein
MTPNRRVHATSLGERPVLLTTCSASAIDNLVIVRWFSGTDLEYPDCLCKSSENLSACLSEAQLETRRTFLLKDKKRLKKAGKSSQARNK